MIEIKLVHCDEKLKKLGINMEEIGSGALLNIELQKTINYINWEYVYLDDNLNVFCEEISEIPDLSHLGDLMEVKPYDSFMG